MRTILFIFLISGCSTASPLPIPLQKETCQTFEGRHWGPVMGNMTLIACREGRDVSGALHMNWPGGERAVEINGVFIYRNTILIKEEGVIWETPGHEWCDDIRYSVGWNGQEIKGTFFSVMCADNTGSFRMFHREDNQGM